MLPAHLSKLIATIIYWSDCEVRRHLVKRSIDLSERAYMGALAFGSSHAMETILKVSTFSYQIDARDDQVRDTAFIFRYGNMVKVAFCEAKLIRFTTPTLGRMKAFTEEWDSPVGNPPITRFSRQIEDSQNVSNAVAFFFQFALDLPQGLQNPPLDKFGSMCIRRENMNAIYKRLKSADNSRSWTLNDLLLVAPTEAENLKSILYDLLICNYGKPLKVSGNHAIYEDGEIPFSVPIPKKELLNSVEPIGSEQVPEISEFMNKHGLTSYKFFDFNNPDTNHFFKSVTVYERFIKNYFYKIEKNR